MTAGALIATQLTDHSSRNKTLTLAGLDLIFQPAQQGNAYGIPIASIEVDEQGPGGVSTIKFDFSDPNGAGPTPNDGDELWYWDCITDVPLFGGFVSKWSSRPMANGQGRIVSIEGVGFESILDWAVLTSDLAIPLGTSLQAAIQSCAANAEGTGSLRAFGGVTSSQAKPVAKLLVGGWLPPDGPTVYAITIAAGTSLREALRLVAQATATIGSASPANPQFTVDFYRGLRAMPDSAAASWASDYATLAVTDTVAGANAADGLEHETDATQIVRGIYIKGANAAGSGLMTDGSGKPGRIAYLEDASIDTAAKLASAQVSYLNQFVVAQRGQFDLRDWTPTAGVRVGSLLVLTDAQANATGTYRLMQITKTFNKSGRENWSLTYGGLRPSAAALIRRLTRLVRS